MSSEPAFASAVEPDAGVDAMLDVLGNRHRRRVLSALVGCNGPVALTDLAAEAGDGAAAPQHVRTTLHHVHLPKLDDIGLVEYDAVTRTAEGTARLRSVADRLLDE